MASEHLGQAAARLRYDHLPVPVRERAREMIVDTLAVICAGLVHPDFAGFAAIAEEPGNYTVPTRANGTSMGTAVLLNGGATTVLQMQDGHRVARGHPASHIVPVLLALGEELGRDHQQIITAFVAGYEVCTRIGIALGGMQAALHDAATWGTIGAAVAAIHLMADGGTGPLMASAIETAAAVAPLPYSRTPVFGATAHHLYIGLGASIGLTAARGAFRGLQGQPLTLETFFLPRAGAAPDARLLCAGIDADGNFSRYELLSGYFKWHPVCAHWSSTADAIAALVAEHGALDQRARRIDVEIYEAALHYDVASPRNELAARFSGRAIVSAMLETGKLPLTGLSDENLRREAFQSRMEMVRIRHAPDLDAGYPAGRPVRVSVKLHDGTILRQSVSKPRGDVLNPLSAVEKEHKAGELLRQAYGDDRAAGVRMAIDSYFAGGAMSDLCRALRG